MSAQRTLCEAIKALLEQDGTLSSSGDTVVFVEDRVDPNAEVKKNATTKLRVMVATTGHARGSDTGAAASGDTALEITVFEDPVRRRSRPDALTVTTAAEAIVAALHWQSVSGSRLRYVDMARADAGEHDYRMVVTLAAEQTFGNGTLAWGLADGSQAYGEITKKRTLRGGTALFEEGRDGMARHCGVRDPHVAVDLTANVESGSTFPALGDAFTCPVDGITTTFTCTASEITETSDAGTTIHLAGRTVGQQ